VYKPAVWAGLLQKRVDKITLIDMSQPSAFVELRKRVLQQATLSIQLLKVLDNLNEKS
jgi:hypothetical protein